MSISIKALRLRIIRPESIKRPWNNWQDLINNSIYAAQTTNQFKIIVAYWLFAYQALSFILTANNVQLIGRRNFYDWINALFLIRGCLILYKVQISIILETL